MTYLENDPDRFAAEALAGLVAAHPDHLIGVFGGAVRATTAEGAVAVVAGGGTGHYPAFAGWIGPGLVHGAACGNVFASPSVAEVASVAEAADNGAGVLFVPINYAGDILNFGAAAEQLGAAGTDVRLVAVTDDVASGDADHRPDRRGIAGSLFVLKVVGAAAEEGTDLDALATLAERANRVTATLGVAYSGCTLPGADQPLFRLAEGKVALGLGIHGEVGLSEFDRTTADDTVDLLLERLVDDHGLRSGSRVAVVLNGLGALSHEELYVAYRRVAERLTGLGIEPVAPAVGEYVTSLEMAGFSITLAVLDEELERLWRAPASSAAFSRGAVGGQPGQRRTTSDGRRPQQAVTQGSPESRSSAAVIRRVLIAARDAVRSAEERLGQLDTVAGDGDHGAGMTRGATAAAEAADRAVDGGAGAGSLLTAAGRAWSERAGGTSGALWGSGLIAMSDVLGNDTIVTADVVVRAVRVFADRIVAMGGAVAGDKTMVDAVLPFASALEAAHDEGADLGSAWQRAADEADRAAQRTAEISARLGRARTHGDKSVGTPDPGAVSFALIVAEISTVLATPDPR